MQGLAVRPGNHSQRAGRCGQRIGIDAEFCCRVIERSRVRVPPRIADHIVPIPGTRSPDHLREHCAGARLDLDAAAIAAIEEDLPLGWAHGDRYSQAQWVGPEKYC